MASDEKAREWKLNIRCRFLERESKRSSVCGSEVLCQRAYLALVAQCMRAALRQLERAASVVMHRHVRRA